jgi:hypothetical protein
MSSIVLSLFAVLALFLCAVPATDALSAKLERLQQQQKHQSSALQPQPESVSESAAELSAVETLTTTTIVPPYAFVPSTLKATIEHMQGWARFAGTTNPPVVCDSSMVVTASITGSSQTTMQLHLTTTDSRFMHTVLQEPPLTLQNPTADDFRSDAECIIALNVVVPKGWKMALSEMHGTVGMRLLDSEVSAKISHEHYWPIATVASSMNPSIATAEENGPTPVLPEIIQETFLSPFILPKFSTCGDGIHAQELDIVMDNFIEDNLKIPGAITGTNTIGNSPVHNNQAYYYNLIFSPCNP